MFDFKKRFLSSVVAFAMILSSFTFTALAEEVEITDVYADVYGVEIQFNEAPASLENYTIEVKDALFDTVEIKELTLDEENGLVNIHFTTPIETGEEYTLKINDTYKSIKVVEIFNENFNSSDLSNVTTAAQNEDGTLDYTEKGAEFEYKKPTQSWRLIENSKADGLFVIDSTLLGDSQENQKLAIFGNGGRFTTYPNSSSWSNPLTNYKNKMTVSAKTQQYIIAAELPEVPSSALYGAYMYTGSIAMSTTSKSAQVLSIRNNAAKLSMTTGTEVTGWGRYDVQVGDTNNGSTVTVGEDDVYGIISDFDEATGTFETVDVTAIEMTHVIRDRNGYASAYAGVGEDLAFAEAVADPEGVTYDSYGGLGFVLKNKSELLVVDDIVATTCEVAESDGAAFVEDAEIVNENIYADLYGVQIKLETPASQSQISNTTVSTLDDETVEATVKFDKTNNLLDVHFADSINMDTYYKLNVNGIEKIFIVNKEKFEDFEGAAFEGIDNMAGTATVSNVEGNDLLKWNFPVQSFITESDDFNAKPEDRKAVVYGGNHTSIYANIGDIIDTTSVANTKFTYYADTQVYKTNVGTNSYYTYLFAGNTTPKKAAVFSIGSKMSRVSRTTFGAAIGDPKFPQYDFTATETATRGVAAPHSNTETVGEITDLAIDKAAGTYSYKLATKATPVKHALRLNGTYLSGYAGKGESMAFTGTLLDDSALTYSSKVIGISTSNSTKYMLVADNILVTTCEVTDYIADAEIENENIYADIYGIDIKIDKMPSVAQIVNTTVSTLSGESVEARAEYDSTNKAINIHFETPIEIGKYYLLNINGTEKTFKVVELIREDFNSLNPATETTATVTDGVADFSKATSKTFVGKDIRWEIKSTAANSGAYVTTDTNYGANANDKKLVLFGNAFISSYVTTSDEYLLDEYRNKLTVTATTQQYKLTDNSGLYHAYVFSGSRNLASNPTVAFSIQNNKSKLSMTDSKADNADWGQYGFLVEDTTKGSIIKTSENNVYGTVAGFTSAAGTYTGVTQATKLTHAVRDLDGRYSGYAGVGNNLVFAQTLADPEGVAYSAHTGVGCSTGHAGTMLVIDDIFVTTCHVTDFVEDAAIKKIYADSYGAVVIFDGEMSGYQDDTVSLASLSGNEVKFTSEYDDETDTLRLDFAEEIKRDTRYVLTIGNETKYIKVKTEIFEDFQDFTDLGEPDPQTLETRDKHVMGQKMRLMGGYATVTEQERFGASKDNKKFLMQGSKLFTRANTIDELDSTISAKVEAFHNGEAGAWNYAYLFKRPTGYSSEGKTYDTASGAGNNIQLHGAYITLLNNKQTYYGNETIVGGAGSYSMVKDYLWKQYGQLGTREGDYNTTGSNIYTYPYLNEDGTEVATVRRTQHNMALRNYDGTLDDEVAASDTFSGFLATGNDMPVYQKTLVDANKVVTGNNFQVGFDASQDVNTIFIVDDLLITTCEVMDSDEIVIDTIEATDVYADKDAIYVEFDTEFEADSSFDAIEVLKDGVAQDFEASAEGKVVTILPEGGVDGESGAIYSVIVPAGYKPTLFTQTEEEYRENFRLTIFADEDFTDYTIGSDSEKDVKVSTNAANQKSAATVWDFEDEKALLLRDNTLSIPSVERATDYVVEFDATVYSAAMTNAVDQMMNSGEVSARYDDPTPNINMWYNSSAEFGAEDAYVWNIKNATTQRKFVADGQDRMNEDAQASTAIAFGDALYYDIDFDGQTDLNLYKYGDNFNSWNLTNFNHIAGYDGTTSIHNPKNYSVKVEKNGRAAKYYLDGALQSAFAGNEVSSASEKGIFAINVSDTEYVVIDNIFVYNYEEIKDVTVALNGAQVSVTNISAESKPVVIIVAAYEGDKMVDAWVSTTTTIGAAGTSTSTIEQTATFTTATTATKYKAFVWDTMSSLIPYCVPAQYNIPTV